MASTSSQKLSGPAIKNDKDIDVRKRAFLMWPIAILLVVAAIVLYMTKARDDAARVAPSTATEAPFEVPAGEAK